MNITGYFLNEDLERGINEFDCMKFCLLKSISFIKNYDYENASLYMENALRSLKELQRLSLKKQNHEKLKKIVECLRNENVDAVLCRRRFIEK